MALRSTVSRGVAVAVFVVSFAMAPSYPAAAAGTGDPRPRPIMAGTVRDLVIAGRFGVPADAAAVAVNLTLVRPAEGTYLTAWPSGQDRPATSNVNAAANATVASAAVVPLGRDGAISLAIGSGFADVLVDVVGWFAAGAFSPGIRRAYDSRSAGGLLRAGETRLIDIGTTALTVATLTAAQPSRQSYLTAWTAGTARPATSNLNLRPGTDMANLAFVQPSADGRISVFNEAGTTSVIVDIVGTIATAVQPVEPTRVLDTRGGLPFVPADARSVTSGLGGASAAVVNITGTDSDTDGFITAWPDGAKPAVSSVNTIRGVAVSNLAIVGLDVGGAFRIATSAPRQHVIVDVVGRIDAASGYTAVPPVRALDTRPDIDLVTVRRGFVFPQGTLHAYASTHTEYPATDVFAACGTPILSPVDGVVSEVRRVDRYDRSNPNPATRGGRSVAVIGDDGVRYYGSHYDIIEPSIEAGVRVAVGTRLGTVGRTGDSAACHLHFGLSPACPGQEWSVRRGVIWPARYLNAWKSGENLSPHGEIQNLSGSALCLAAMRDPNAPAAYP